jgi:hypothetical protein
MMIMNETVSILVELLLWLMIVEVFIIFNLWLITGIFG